MIIYTVCALIRGTGESVLYGSKYSKMKKWEPNCGAYGVHHNFFLFLWTIGTPSINHNKLQVCLTCTDHNNPTILKEGHYEGAYRVPCFFIKLALHFKEYSKLLGSKNYVNNSAGTSDLYGSKYSKWQYEGQNCGAYGVLHNFTFVLFLGLPGFI